MIDPTMIELTLPADQMGRLERHMQGEIAGELIDVGIQHLLLNTSIPVEERAGVGHVIKLLISLRNGDNLHVTKRDEPVR